MFPDHIVAVSAGTLCVSAVAVFIAFFQYYFFLKKPEFDWNGWGALLSFATSLYAMAVFVQFNTVAGQLNRFSELLQYTSFIFIIHGLYGFTFSYFGLSLRSYNRVFLPMHGTMLVILWFTDWFISNNFITRHPLLSSVPYVEPELSPLGVLYLAYIATAALYLSRYWLKNRRMPGRRTGAFMVGFAIWLVLGIHDALATMGLPLILFIMEYGFLAFSLSTLTVAIQSYADLYDLVEQREEILFAQKERLDVTLRSIGEGFIATDRLGNIVLFNQMAEKLCGLKNNEALGLPVEDVFRILLPNDLETAVGRGIPDISSAYPGVAVLQGIDGGRRVVSVTRNPISARMGAPSGEVLLFQDITEWVRAQDALQVSEEKYRSILENMEEGYYEQDLSGNFTFFNPALCRVLGYNSRDLSSLNLGDCVDAPTGKKLSNLFHELYKSGEPIQMTEFDAVTQDGSMRHMECSASLILDNQGRPIGFRGLMRDVTERNSARTERLNLEKQLFQAQKMEAVGTLAGGVAHDFNNLLIGMQGTVTSLLHSSEPSQQRLRKPLENLEKYIQDASNLTRQLLGFARKGKYEKTTMETNEMVAKAADMFGRTRKDVSVRTELQDCKPVDVDPGQFEQVLMNLFVNSWQAMEKEGAIFIKTQNSQPSPLFLSTHDLKPGIYVRITVTDTGQGMDKETLQKVFDPFFTTKDQSRGTGLGLSSAYGIVRNHGGIITVQSAPGAGATFEIYLPANDSAPQKKKAPAEKWDSGRGTILLIDDEQIIVQAATDLLKILGYQVLTARSGQEALAVYQKHQQEIDLVILDMIMPGLGGGAVFRELKKINPESRILVSSGFSPEDQADDVVKNGAHGFIQKPFNLQTLSEKLQDVLPSRLKVS